MPDQPKPNPGSKEAAEQGCICAVFDNHYGQGFGNPPRFWITGGCPVHANEQPHATKGEV